MRKVLDLKNVQVFDDVLKHEQFQKLFDWYNSLPFIWKDAQQEWNKSWSTTDGSILISKKMLFNSTLTDRLLVEDAPLQPFLDQVSSVLSFFNTEAIEKIGITPYVWPPGVGLSWHSDSNYEGAITYYAHNYWSSNWSGEFLTVEGDSYLEKPDDLKWRVFDNSQLDELIMNHGIGNFIQPKPNRLVLSKAGANGILHKVNRSTLQARDRLTLQGFLHKK